MSKSQTKQKKSSAAKNVAIFFIVFVILEGLIIFGLSRLFKNEDTVVKLGGYSFFLMDSDNMSPDAPKESLVIASNGTPSTDKIGYPMLCRNVGNQGTTVAWLKEIGSKGDTVDGVVYTVFQNSDNTVTYDLSSSDIVGIATSYYMTAGKIVSFVITPFGMGICIIAPLVLLVLIELIMAIARRSRDDDYDDDDEYDDEDEEDGVTLDDFLYGGENDDVYVGGKPKDTYEEEFEDKYASMMNRQTEPAKPAYDEPVYEEPVYEEPVYEEPVAEPDYEETAVEEAIPEEKPQIDQSYYERASKMIDDAVAVKAEEPEVAVAAPVSEPETESRPQRSAQHRPQSGQRRRPPQSGARRRPANGQSRPGPAAGQRQNANAALEQLMKMMEEEQNKLKEQNKD